ncbi:hypothetical protein [Nocardia araoensis]|uniref:hypothetical protein n=1 Tax=Nocardia araoensis TaxID=228600 RepID=UPI0002DC1E0D|nr:hypothetical protein [Nocardia araoensis]
MNPLLLIGGAVLAVGLLGLIVSVLLRPTGSKAHVTVADLQARLAQEQSATSPDADDSADDEPESDPPHTADAEAADSGREEPEQPTDADELRDAAADAATDEGAGQVLLPDRRRRAD